LVGAGHHDRQGNGGLNSDPLLSLESSTFAAA